MLDIRNSIIKELKTSFPDHKIYGEKVTQGLVKPCFFVDLIPIDLVKVNSNLQERSMFVDIQYMSVEDTKVKNLEMAEKLGQMFSLVEFNGFRVRPTNGRFEIIDKILHYLFDLDFKVFGQETETSPLMGEVKLKEEVL